MTDLPNSTKSQGIEPFPASRGGIYRVRAMETFKSIICIGLIPKLVVTTITRYSGAEPPGLRARTAERSVASR